MSELFCRPASEPVEAASRRVEHATRRRVHTFLNRFLAFSIILGAVTLLLTARAARAENLELDPDQIKAMLHTVSDIEGGFVDRVVGMVKAGTLPRDLFTSSLIWARKKPRHQFQYFKQALTARAAQIGITLDVPKSS